MSYIPKLSPSALNRFLACEYRTYLDMLERRGELDAKRQPPQMQLLLARGETFEEDVLEAMINEGLRVISLDDSRVSRKERAARTVAVHVDARSDGVPHKKYPVGSRHTEFTQHLFMRHTRSVGPPVGAQSVAVYLK